MQEAEYLQRVYANRFDPSQRRAKLILWKVLIQDFLQKRIRPEAAVLDIAGGYGEFINQVQAGKKVLIDLNPDAKNFAAPDVTVLNLNIFSASDSRLVPPNSFDTIFVSNFFEHLRTQAELIEILAFCFSRLKPGGNLLVIQPNFKYSYREYYDFIDHYLPITEGSLAEVLKAVGFRIDELVPRFLPFTTKGRPSSPHLLRLYLKIPLLWKIFGGQLFVNAAKPMS